MTRKPFNILFLNETSGPGGAETVLFNIANNLDRDLFIPSVALFRPGWFYDFLAEHGIQVSVIPSQKSWDFAFLFRLIRFCRNNEIKVIHAHLPGANLYGSIAGKILGIPVICTFHNELALPGAHERYRNLRYFLIRNFASSLIFVADFMKNEYLLKAKFPVKKVQTIYNGVPEYPKDNNYSIEAFKKEIDFHDGEILIANIANFRTPKGHDILVDAAKLVCSKNRRAKFLLIGEEGDGTIKNRISDKIDSYQLRDKIKFLGFRKDIPQILRSIDIFLLASISEGLPVSIVEAMMAARPVIATNVGGIPEVVKSGQTGYLVNPGDPVSLADRISELVLNNELRLEMGERGKEFAISLFSLKTMISKYQELYLELLK